MTDFSKPSKIVAAYTADVWEHVCPIIRITEPLQTAGFFVKHGSTWLDGKLDVNLKIIPGADFVLIARDFPSRSDKYEQVVETARHFHKRIVYELDDLLVDLPSDHPDFDHYLPIKPGVIQAVMDADAVTVSTNGLADFLQPFNPNIYVLPNYLIDRFWKLPPTAAAPEEDRPVTIGYMGGHGHKPDLEMVLPALERVLDKFGERVQIMFWGIRPPERWDELPNVRWTIPYLVSYEEFVQYFLGQSADIFIAPLQDNLFNRCKSPLKYIEYSAMRIPGVYSDLPSYRELISPGENGFLASTVEEWEAALTALVEDAGLRQRVGSAAQKTVREKCLLGLNAYRWQEIYEKIPTLSGPRDRLSELSNERYYLRTWYASLAERFALEKKNRIATGEALQARGVELQQRSDELKQRDFELQHMTNQANALRGQIEGIINSRGWKALQRVYELRLKLLPRGSKRERLLRFAYKGVTTWRREGLRSLLRKSWDKITGRVPVPVITQTAEHSLVAFSAEPGTIYSNPLVSIIIRRPAYNGDVQDVVQWALSSTFRSCEVVVWDQNENQAWKAGCEDQKQPAEDFEALKAQLLGKYVCFASTDLLNQSPTYLQTNLTALETESLAFTVNTHWNDTVIVQKIQVGEFPGSPHTPLFRQIVAKELIDNDLKIDLSSYAADAFVAGKFILNETGQPEDVQSWPFQAASEGFTFQVEGQWILCCRGVRKDQFPVQHVIHPADSILPNLSPDESKPVILVLIQFLAVGGAERLLLKLVEYLKDEFTFVIVGMERQAGHLGTTADAFRKVTPYVFPLATFLNPALSFSFLTYLIHSFQPEVLYVANGSSWIYDAISELHRCFPALRMVNQVYDHQFGWINRYDPAIVDSFKGHISANLKISDAYLQKGVPAEQVYFIEHCIDMNEVNPERYSEDEIADIKSRLGLPKGKRIVAFIARFHPQKRPMDFVELSRRSTSDSSLHFLMVGDGPLSDVVDGYVRKNQPKNLSVRRFYKPITDIYAAMDVLVLPSEYEAMPLVVLEAQAMGKPVVVTDVGSNRDVVEDTAGGVVVPKIGDVKALSDGLAKVFAEPIDSASVRSRIHDRFGTEKIAAQYRAAFLGEKNG